MPINVFCPECQSRFLVDDEFAGRPGRCPECGNVIRVPVPESDLPSHNDEPFDEFPAHSRRRDRDQYEQDLHRDFDDEPRGRSFDPHGRAAAWQRVYKGFGYLQIGVVLYFFGQILQTGFFLIRGIENQNPNALPDSGEIAVGLGGLFIMLMAATFWFLGRLAAIKVPYVPARGWARASFYMVLGGIGSMFGFCCLFTGGLVAAGAGPNGGAVAMVMLSLFALLLGMVLVAGAELCGLVSLAKIGDGLRAPNAANWARMSVVLMILLIGGMTMGFCGLTVYAANEQNKRQQAQAMNGANANGLQDKDKKKDDAPAVKDKDKKDDANNAPDNKNQNQQAQQQPNPFDDGPFDEKTQFVIQSIMIGLILLYLIQYSVSLQKCRRAIRHEIETLTGGDRDRHDREHY